LEVIDVFDQHAALNEHGGEFAGLDRFDARKKVAKALEETGLLPLLLDQMVCLRM